MKTVYEIKREWLVWLIREELLLRNPDAIGDQPGGWRVLARETAGYYERGEEVPEAHRKKAYAARTANNALYAIYAAWAAAEGDCVYAASECGYAATANLGGCSTNDADDANRYGDVNTHNRMAIALVRIADIEPLPELDANILTAIEGGNTLEMDIFHTCETTHCRAGFAITLHPRGRELEEEFGSRLVGGAIYLVSTGTIPNFFATNEDALASIRKGAGL